MVKRRKKKTGKILLILFLLAAAGAAAAWFLYFRGLYGKTANGSAPAVYVRSVSDILNEDGGALVSGRFAGVVEARELVKLKLDTEKTLDETFVAPGDRVSPGTPLFSYDADKLELAYEQLKLDVEGKKGTIATYEDEIAKLDKQIAKTKKTAQKAELTVQRQTAELKLKKEQYELKGIEKQAADAAAVLRDNVIRSSVSGTVRSVTPPAENDQDIYGGSTDNTFITIVVGNDLRVAGTVSEQNVMRLAQGTEVTVRSRINERDVRPGVIEEVNTEEPVKNESSGYYGGNDAEQSSKYRFYVKLDSAESLIVGQHVYIDLGGLSGGKSSVMLPEWYIVDDGADTFVFAANARNVLEKRKVTLGSYDAESSCYAVLSGLSLSDRIAFPDETTAAGMPATDAAYVEEEEPGYDMDTAFVAVVAED